MQKLSELTYAAHLKHIAYLMCVVYPGVKLHFYHQMLMAKFFFFWFLFTDVLVFNKGG